jgi:hypothetical protein
MNGNSHLLLNLFHNDLDRQHGRPAGWLIEKLNMMPDPFSRNSPECPLLRPNGANGDPLSDTPARPQAKQMDC